MIIFTSICANYLHKARTLAKSVKENIPDAIFIVCLLETEKSNAVNYEYFDDVVLARDAWGDGFNRFIFKHTIVEASTSVKGQFFKYLYNRFTEDDKFIYLDPDVYVYSDFIELREILNARPIVLCPHLLQPGNIDMELSSTAHGVYNLGFLAVNRSEEAQKFINWWADRLYLFCYDDMGRGIFTDQKWIDLAPCFFDVEIFKHKGYDFATWSLLDCGMDEKNGRVFVQGDELRFIHYSGYRATIDACIDKWLPKGEHPFKKLFSAYATIHDENDTDKVSKSKWTYGYYNSGEKISDSVRKKYRSSYDTMFICENPFDKSNEFYEKCENGKVKTADLIGYISKIQKVYKNDGAVVLLKKIIRKLK